MNFKELWEPNEFMGWYDFDIAQIEKSALKDSTKEFLKDGFPESAAPFLGFGLLGYDCEFCTIAEYYDDPDLAEATQNYWFFGSDGSGNPICIDSESDDRIILLDHEDNFEIFQTMNKNVLELAQCLLEYRRFVEQTRARYGHDGLIKSKYTLSDLEELKMNFLAINPTIFTESDFWEQEIEYLYLQI